MTDDKVKQLVEEKNKFILMNQNNNVDLEQPIITEKDPPKKVTEEPQQNKDNNIQIWL